MSSFVASASLNFGGEIGSERVAVGPYVGLESFLTRLHTDPNVTGPDSRGGVFTIGARIAARF
jgi:hypothetical protein